jgi:GMP synthase-like glutamine amidotransferase
LQWHSAEVVQMPAGASCLATSPDCAVQAMRWGTRAYSMQFHVEIESQTVPTWAEIPEYAASLEKALGSGAIDALATECQKNMEKFNEVAERIYMNWLQTSAQA